MAKLESIHNFFEQKSVAVAGVSRSRNKFGSIVYRQLKKKKYKVYPVNPHMDSYEGEKCYPDLATLPDDTKAVFINTSPAHSFDLVKQAGHKGIQHIWVQNGAENHELIEYAKDKPGIITKECIVMFAEPLSFPHSIHRSIRKLFGKYPD